MASTKDACSISSHCKRMLNEDDHKRRQGMSQKPRSSSLWSILGMLISYAVMCYWTNVPMQPSFVSLLVCTLKHYICWQGQDSISCACSLVNANPGDPCIGEWGKATILPEACCAWCSWGDRGANENCRGRVPVKERTTCAVLSAMQGILY